MTYGVFLFCVGSILGFTIGWAWCQNSYVRYKKTSDAMRVVDDFGRSLYQDLSETEFSKNRR